ncbi:MAG: LLM class flavin-dependent oxidoreductase, partial [Staphylococcus epidermidis]|nr:LLM class flavin-dependent oxidoreductase [Staphylococcus epidermidis]
TVKQKLESFIKEYGDIDELMAISYIYDQDKQIESYRRLERAIKS